MAGVTDASFRQIIKHVAPSTLLYSEFLSTNAITYGAERTLRDMQFDPAIERPFIVQIFGADPQVFLEACKVIEQMGADGIDINMGCPAAKIVSSCYGSALIRRPDLAAELVAAAVKAVRIPISVKTRLGWDTHETLIPFCQVLEQAGAAAFAIHGRLYHDKFTGHARWEPIYELKKHVRVPVLGNGDIASAADALAKLGNLDGVMVGRATWGNPWLLRDIADAFALGASPPSHEQDPRQRFVSRIPAILQHYEIAIRLKGEKRGILEMRRHLSGYIKGFDGAKELRTRLMLLESFDIVRHELLTLAS